MEDKLKEFAEKLYEERPEIPQIFFVADIIPQSGIELRKKISEFKTEFPNCKEVDVILHSPGGLAHDAYRIIRNLRDSFEIVNIIIPFWAKSAATLVTLGASKIYMDDYSELGPLDAQIGKAREDGPQFDHESALNDEYSLERIESRFIEMYEKMYVRIYEHDGIKIPKNELSKQLMKNLAQFYKPVMKQINPYKLGEKRRYLDIGKVYANRIMLQYGSYKTMRSVRVLVHYLVNECPDHGLVVDYNLLKDLLTNIYKTNEVSEKYAAIISEVSLFFMEDNIKSDFIDIFHNLNSENNEQKKDDNSENVN